MKKITTLLVSFLLLSSVVKAQYVNIPDSNFAKYLITQVPGCLYEDSVNVKFYMDTTCSGVKNLTIMQCDSSKLKNVAYINDITGIEYFTSLISFTCNHSMIRQINKLPPYLDTLIVFYNNISSIQSLPNTLKVLVVSSNQLTTLPAIPPGLNVFIVDHNPITAIPDLKNYPIGYFDVDNTLITSLKSFPDSANFVLVYSTPSLYCLPAIPNNAGSLYLDTSHIKCLTDIPSGFVFRDSTGKTLTMQVCSSTYNPHGCYVIPANYVNIPDSNFAKYLITQIPSCLFKDSSNLYWMDTTCSGVLNTNSINCNNLNIRNLEGIEYFKKIWSISCDSNQLVSLPDIIRLQSLSTLSCKKNQLATLPQINSYNMYQIDCSNNLITSLPTLPPMLNYLNCNNNLFTELPVFDYPLFQVEFKNNQITNLNVPGYNSLRYLYCDSNNITNVSFAASYLDSSSLEVLSLSGNSNLTCLPHLPYIGILNISGTNISCLPNIPPSSFFDSFQCIPANIPVCSKSYDPSNCTIYNNYVNIPDSNFAKYLISQLPSCLFKDSSNLYWMDTTCSGVKNTINLFVQNDSIKDLTGVEYFINLKVLNCENNQITFLYFFPDSLTELYCSNNQIYSLVNLPTSLNSIYCDNNLLRGFRTLPDSLTLLSCSYNRIQNLTNLPNSINTLYCDNNVLASISNLPTSLYTLNCDNNLLTSLPTLPNSLNNLSCNNNQLQSLSTLPDSLLYLSCSNNQLTNLPGFPNTLNELDCGNNLITSLPLLSTALLELVCNNNQLTSLPYLAQSLTYLDCDSNQLTSLPIDHYFDSLIVSCRANKNLNCLPLLPLYLEYIDVTGTGITCLPNIPPISFFTFTCTPNLPICNPTNNANQCQPFPIVSGKVFTDDNSNGIKDSNEYYRPFVQLTLNTGESVVTNTNGEFKLNLTDTGTYTLTTRLPNGFKASPASNTFTFNNNNSSLTLPDIALQPLGVYDSLTVFITPWTGPDTKPAAQLQYFVSYENVGYYYNIQDSIKITYDTSKLQFDSSSIPLINQSGNTILASVDSLFPGIFNYFFLYFSVKTTAASGDSLLANATITSQYSTDTSFCQVNVVSSFDPNSKDATPILSPAQVANGTFIDYTIHFQNTGNDTAYNIVLADTLSPLLQSNILQVVATSHPCNITLNDSIIYFEFLKVNIPDSGHNQFKSNGFVHFRLLPVSTVATGSTIYNKASIYFDYNKPVVTNTASTFITPFALPVIISNYTVTALPAKEGIQVTAVVNNWNTSTEINTDYYNIQRSLDGIHFYTAGKVTAKGAGSYSFTDSLTIHDSRLTILYYRLQIVDKNGKISYSDTKQITIQPQLASVSIYPNPARNSIVIRGNNVSAINIIDNTGRLVMSKNGLDKNAVENKLNINLSNGIYLAQIIQADGKKIFEKLIIEN